jgi:hypothetical protein
VDNGYGTAIFTENPTFSSQNGFGHHIQSLNEDIHTKIFQSEFSPFGYVDSVNVAEGMKLIKEIISRPNRIRNLVNAGYTTYLQFVDPDPSFPHHGGRVLEHVSGYLNRGADPTLTVTNVLEPHNPYYDTPPGTNESRQKREMDALRAGDDNRVYLLTDERPPELVATAYDDWDGFFQAQELVYEEYASESDRLLRMWHDDHLDLFEDALVVVVGDHGQLFNAEGMVGHHTSLHPHGINVPLAVDPPSSWDTPKISLDTPVSTAGLGSTLSAVLSGDINSTGEFVKSVAERSREAGDAVLSCADGPVWSIPTLLNHERFDDDLIKQLAVRKVACVRDGFVDIYQSRWSEEMIEATSYEYSSEKRTVVKGRDTPPAPTKVSRWLSRTYDMEHEQRDTVDKRLEALGYV